MQNSFCFFLGSTFLNFGCLANFSWYLLMRAESPPAPRDHQGQNEENEKKKKKNRKGVDRTPWQGALLLQHSQDPKGTVINQAHTVCVVRKGHWLQQHSLALALFLLVLKDVLIEKILESLVAVVNTQLLEAILVKNFKAKNIQNSHVARRDSLRLKKWRRRK